MATRTAIERDYPDIQTEVATNAKDAIATLRDRVNGFHRILLDLDVPGAQGLSLALSVQGFGLHRQCCIVTGMDRTDLAEQCRSLGFRGYVVKSMPVVHFVESLRKLFAAETGFIGLDDTSAKISETVRITRRQSQILDLVQHGRSSKQIASAISLSVGTVDNHVNAAIHALGVSSRSHAVAKAIALGLIRVDSNPG